jgi:hypothetical protein
LPEEKKRELGDRFRGRVRPPEHPLAAPETTESVCTRQRVAPTTVRAASAAKTASLARHHSHQARSKSALGVNEVERDEKTCTWDDRAAEAGEFASEKRAHCNPEVCGESEHGDRTSSAR